jgi:hypothetical protein
MTDEKNWDMVLKSLNKNKFPEDYLKNHTFTLRWCNYCNDYRTLISNERKSSPRLQPEERLRIIRENRENYTNDARLKNVMVKIWNSKKKMLKNIDWITNEETMDEVEMMKRKIMDWRAGVKKTLQLGSDDIKAKSLKKIVGQRFRKSRGSNNVDGSKLMMTRLAKFYFEHLLDAKSYVETSRVVDYTFNYLRCGGSYYYNKEKIGHLMVIHAVKQFDKLALLLKEVPEKITLLLDGLLENGWKPRNHSAATDVIGLDDIDSQL